MKLLLKRLAQLIGFLVLVLVLAVAALHWYQPKVPLVVLPPPKPVSGAAVFYNQAFAAMPELGKEEKKLLITKPDVPLDVTAAKQLLAKYDACLQLLAQGAALPECEWGLDYSHGPFIKLLHLTQQIELCQLLGMRSRLHLLNGEVPAATDDLLLIFRFSRHVGQTMIVIPRLLEMTDDMIAINLAARHLQEFDPSSLQRLSEGIATLPPSASLRERVALENKNFVVYMQNGLARQYASKWKKAQSNPALHVEKNTESSGGEIGAIYSLIDASPSIYLITLRRFERDSHELEILMDVPFPEGRRKIDAFSKKFEIDMGMRNVLDIWSYLMLPTNAGLRVKEVQMETMWTTLRTALDAQIHNPSSVRGELAKIRDPYDGGPIEMRDVPGGVELQLKSEPYRKPMTLMVGLAGK